MAPRKTKAQPSASQPPPTESRPLRSTRSKRRLSDPPEASANDLPSQAEPSTPAKRRKKNANPPTGFSPHREQLDELPEDAHYGAEATEQQQELSQANHKVDAETRHVQFSDQVYIHDDGDVQASPPATVPLQRMLVKRRNTISPGSASKRFRTASTRQSLAAEGFVKQEDAGMPFAPLREVLRDRVEHLLSLSKKDGLQKGQTNGQNTHIAESDDMMVIDDHDDLLDTARMARQRLSYIPDPPSSPYSAADAAEENVLAQSSRAWSNERHDLQDHIVTLSAEVNRSAARLRVLQVELQAVTSSEEDVSISAMIEDIRKSYDHAREALYSVLPVASDSNMTSFQMLDTVVSTLKEFANRSKLQDGELDVQADLVSVYHSQVTGLLDRLASSEVNNIQVEAQHSETVEALTHLNNVTIPELNEVITEEQHENDKLSRELAERSQQLATQEQENDHLTRSIERLKESLNGYREEEQRLQVLINRMEANHGNLIGKMNMEREALIKEHESRLDAGAQLCAELEAQASSKDEQIIQLESAITELNDQHSSLLEQLAGIRHDLKSEQDSREQAELALQTRDAEVDSRERRVTSLEEELDDLHATLAQLREASSSDRAGLDATMHELDASREHTQDLESKLQEMGLDANRLRQKMFEVQQRHEAQIAEFETAVSARDNQYKSDMGQEVTRRELAENAVQARDATIATLEERLQDVEDQMAELIVEHNDQLRRSQEQIAHNDHNISKLTQELHMSEKSRRNEAAIAAETQLQHEASISALKDTIAEHELRIQSLVQDVDELDDLYNAEINSGNDALTQVTAELAETRVMIASLQAQKAGLEHRVEQEAIQMLQDQNEKQDEIDDLRALIEDKQHKIQTVEQKARETDERWEELMHERKKEISILQDVNDEKTEEIASLSTQVQYLLDKLAGLVQHMQTGMRTVADASTIANGTIQQQSSTLDEESKSILHELQHFNHHASTTAKHDIRRSTTHPQGEKKRRVYDSGFGVASDEADALEA